MAKIFSQPTPFYQALARSGAQAASAYGGADFALAMGGNEMPGYHTGPAAHLAYLTGARHSHLDSAGYSVDQGAARSGESLDPQGVADSLLDEERWRQVLASLSVCFFARSVYTPQTTLRALAAVGIDWTEADLKRLGADTLRRKYGFKRREGFEPDQLRIPQRILQTRSPLGQVDEEFLREAIARFVSEV